MSGTIERNTSNLHDSDTGEMVGYKNPVTGKEMSVNSTALAALVSRGGNDTALRLGLQGPVYVNQSYGERPVVNGTEVYNSRATMSFQDLFWEPGSLRLTLTNKANIELLNVGQLLVPIPGAVSPPYWTDPGPITLTRSADDIPSTLDPHISWVEANQTWVLRSLPGYGDAADAHRRSQLWFGNVSGRRRVCWDLSFRIPEEDDVPYAPTWAYKMLIFQFKGATFPFIGLNVESVGDGTLRMFWAQVYSSDLTDVSTYNRQFNANATNTTAATSGGVRLFEYIFRKNAWMDILIESNLDERNVDAAGGGHGFTNVWINGEQVLAYSGPTLTYRDTGGTTPDPHRWMIGVYRHESGAPSDLLELDLDRPTDPAPYTRATEWRRAKLMDLGPI